MFLINPHAMPAVKMGWLPFTMDATLWKRLQVGNLFAGRTGQRPGLELTTVKLGILLPNPSLSCPSPLENTQKNKGTTIA